MQAECPKCHFQFQASSGLAGQRSVCPRCHHSFDAFTTGDTVVVRGPGKSVAEAIAEDAHFGPRSPAGDAVGRQFEEYRIVEELGRGGMGVVYRAVQETLDRPVALKMILAGEAAGEEEVKSFLREAAAVARLRHPNIVTIYELDVHEGIYYYTMDFVKGQDLGALIADGPLDQRLATILAEKVAQALAHAHSKDIVHRDLKPGNIIIDENGEPVITDFGLAFDLRQRQDGTPELAAGTPGYMAPEQALGLPQATGPACDIYSLGALFYELLTGLPPFMAGDPETLMNLIIETDPDDPRDYQPDLDPGLAAICMKCLQKNPEDRYASADELAKALGTWLDTH